MMVVGTGGAARAVLAAGRSLGCELYVLGRSEERTRRVADEFGGHAVKAAGAKPATLIVQATSMGRDAAGPPDIDLLPWIGSGTYVLDMVYDPTDRYLREATGARGGIYEGGYRLLVYQAMESYRIWWGHAPSEAMVERAASERS